MTGKIIGRPLPRVEGAEKVSGALCYTRPIIIGPALCGARCCAVPMLMRVSSTSISAGRKILSGVKAIVTAADLDPQLIGAVLKDMPVLAQDRVRYVGEDIAAVAAVDADTAEEAIHLIDVEYEELPAVFDPLEAMTPEAPVLHPDYERYQGPKTKAPTLKNIQTLVRASKGDIERGFAESDQVFENSFRTQLVHQGYLEPYAITVEVDKQGRLAIWVTNQSVFKLRKVLGEYFDMPLEMITIHPSNMGGSFGAKDYPSLAPAAYHLSKQTGLPGALRKKLHRRADRHLAAPSRRSPAPHRGEKGRQALGVGRKDFLQRRRLRRLQTQSPGIDERGLHGRGLVQYSAHAARRLLCLHQSGSRRLFPRARRDPDSLRGGEPYRHDGASDGHRPAGISFAQRP